MPAGEKNPNQILFSSGFVRNTFARQKTTEKLKQGKKVFKYSKIDCVKESASSHS